MSALTTTTASGLITNEQREALAEKLITGDLSHLTAVERVLYYRAMCDRCGLDPISRPFDYIETVEKGKDGQPDKRKLSLYPNQIAAAQLRRIHRVSLRVVDRRAEEGLYIVTCEASTPDGRTIESMGAVPLVDYGGKALSPLSRASAIKKSETQAYRRATIAICGLDFAGSEIDESETRKAEFFDPPLDAIDTTVTVQAPRLPQVTETSAIAHRIPDFISKADQGALWKAARAAGYSAEIAQTALASLGIKSFTEIPIARAEEVRAVLTSREKAVAYGAES